ncbi:winged helix/forkhead transcription factor [Lithospermum erythrorhizon]|uniref:Winged helix/forkhead transcription factor n=1 Tax=Lithospermum erythrorhizon TaxID=34254 RepID=A0AAV3QNN7_LITER
MGEVVVNSEVGSRIGVIAKGVDMEIENQTRVVNDGGGGGDGDGGGADGGSTSAAASSGVVRWERFLPNKVMRVLLVEADDSTRQIITALLRKCSFRVAAVSDGLKAWEVLRKRPHNIDLILTEVDLPSISGFALLTLIMEHEICKNIPVIMMSSQDSVSTVYKCMLRGAADFLVKPVRKNELKNMWQHVWRRQASSGGAHGPPDESVAQPKVEATAENNATSNHSSGYKVCLQSTDERIDKRSDAQSSCTKPEMDAEEAECTQELPQPKGIKCVSGDKNVKRHEVTCVSKNLQTQEGHLIGPQVATRYDCETSKTEDENVNDQWKQRNFVSQPPDSHACASPSREAIDLIGAFNNYLKCSYGSPTPNIGTTNIDSSPLLDLSLRRSNPSGSVNQGLDERPRLNHSDASAFSRYVNRTLPPSTAPSNCNQQKYCENYSDKQISIDYNSEARAHTIGSQNYFPLSISQPGQSEIAYCRPEQRAIQAPIPVRGSRLENLVNVHGIPQIFCMQSESFPAQRPGLSGHQQASTQANAIHTRPLDQGPENLHQYNCRMETTCNDVTEQSDSRQEHKLETLDHGYFSSATDQSTNGSFGNGAISHFHSISCRSNNKVNDIPGMNDMFQYPLSDVNSHRAMQREAALHKFRLKRKERCFEKKVRYESRKKLAEQRPRVKGQFVRQVHNDAPTGTSAD